MSAEMVDRLRRWAKYAETAGDEDALTDAADRIEELEALADQLVAALLHSSPHPGIGQQFARYRAEYDRALIAYRSAKGES